MGRGYDYHIELALLKPQVGELFAGGFGELRNYFLARGGEPLARAHDFRVQFFQRRVEPRKFGVATFERVQFHFGRFAERDDFGERRAVFALEGAQQIHPFLELLKLRGVHVHLLGVTRQFRLQLAQCRAGLAVQLHEVRGRGIHAVKFRQHPADDAGLREQGILILAQGVERGLAQLQQFGGVAGALKILLHAQIFTGLKPRAGNLLYLKAQQVQLLGIGPFIYDEQGFFRLQRGAAPDQFTKSGTILFQAPEGIEDGELFGGMQQGLVIVRAVHVHQPLADGGERGEGRGRTIDELAVGARIGECALEDKPMVVAGLQAVFIEKAFQRSAQLLHVEHGLDGATVAAAADEGTIGAFAEDEVERADDDGLARAGFAGNDVEARPELERQVRNEGEVFDAKRRQHVRFGREKIGRRDGRNIDASLCQRRLNSRAKACAGLVPKKFHVYPCSSVLELNSLRSGNERKF